jgi:hypothetical protein
MAYDSITAGVRFDPVAIVVGSRQFLGPSPKRYRLTIFPPSGSRITISNDPITADGNGITLSPGQTPIEFCRDEHGDFLGKPWFVFYIAGATPIAWVETFL